MGMVRCIFGFRCCCRDSGIVDGVTGIGMKTNWVANGLSQDLPAQVVMQGVWQGQDLAIWRAVSGKISAWKDRCPHRGMRLSHGFVRGETLNCIYHGWVYGVDGGCRHIPAHPAMVPPASIKTESYVCHEQDGLIWIGPDGPEGPPPALGGLIAVRSVTARVSVARLCAALPNMAASGPILRGEVQHGAERVDICLVLQKKAADATSIHALCGRASDRVAVSRWLDGMRRRVEAERLA